ncbi:MAG TPA: hypothetical protein VFM30_08405 [Steroidobacteraceae bacterium]|nr:hypothetical protein [Steroidobacteraceae bacterium]
MRRLAILLLAFAAQGALADEPAAPQEKPKVAEEEFKPPPGFVTKKRGKLTLYCVKDSTVGTRFKTERCYDKTQVREYLAAQEENKRNVDRIRNTCGGGTACASN